MVNTKDELIKVMIDPFPYTQKPKDIRLVKYTTVTKALPLSTIVYDVCHGCSITPGVLVGGWSSSNWVQQQLIGLDYDEGETMDHAIEQFKERGLEPCFVYTTFSHREDDPRFRVFFCLDEALIEYEKRNLVVAALHQFSDKSDQSGKNADRTFYGSNCEKPYYYNPDARVNADQIIDIFWTDPSIPKTGKNKERSKKLESKEENRKIEKPKRISNVKYVESYYPVDEYPYSTKPFMDKAKNILNVMDELFNIREWTEATRREKFIFIMYNCAKQLYGSEKAYEMINDYNDRMTEPLTKYVLNSGVIHTDCHVELSGKHGDGFFAFGLDTVIGSTYLNVSPEELEELGLSNAISEKEKRKINRELKANNVQAIIDTFFQLQEEGKASCRKIAEALLPEIKVSKSFVNKIINEYNLKNLSGKEEVVIQGHKDEKLANTEDTLYNPYLREIQIQESERKISLSKVEHLLKNNKNTIILGPAGSGKTTLLNQYIAGIPKSQILVLAPTGLASTNYGAEAKTIHRGIKLSVKDFYHKEEKGDIKCLIGIKVVVVDEVGSIRLDIFNALINTIKLAEKEYKQEIQLIMLGDVFQLPPFMEGKICGRYANEYRTNMPYFFSGEVFEELNPVMISTEGQYHRCEDKEFNMNLERIRNFDTSNLCYFDQFGDNTRYYDDSLVHLCAHNSVVDDINRTIVEKKKKENSYKTFRAVPVCKNKKEIVTIDKYNEGEFPVAFKIDVFEGMRIMTVINERDGHYSNGSLLEVMNIYNNHIECANIKTGEAVNIYKEVIYSNDNEKESIVQLPIKEAYALTIHKSQGQTLEGAIIHPNCFDYGMLYSALSRVADINQLVICGKIKKTDIKINKVVKRFYQEYLEKAYFIED